MGEKNLKKNWRRILSLFVISGKTKSKTFFFQVDGPCARVHTWMHFCDMFRFRYYVCFCCFFSFVCSVSNLSILDAFVFVLFSFWICFFSSQGNVIIVGNSVLFSILIFYLSKLCNGKTKQNIILIRNPLLYLFVPWLFLCHVCMGRRFSSWTNSHKRFQYLILHFERNEQMAAKKRVQLLLKIQYEQHWTVWVGECISKSTTAEAIFHLMIVFWWQIIREKTKWKKGKNFNVQSFCLSFKNTLFRYRRIASTVFFSDSFVDFFGVFFSSISAVVVVVVMNAIIVKTKAKVMYHVIHTDHSAAMARYANPNIHNDSNSINAHYTHNR